LNGSFADPGFEQHTVVIDWGDGSQPDTLILAAGVEDFTATHVYADDPSDGTSDDYLVSVSVTDEDLAQDTAVTPITIANVAPIPRIVNAGSDSTTVRLSANVTDAGTDNFTYAWTVTGTTLPPGTPTDQPTISFPRPVGGVAAVSLTVTDDDGGSTTTDVLFVAGTAGGDTINITPTADANDDPDALSVTVTTDTTGTSNQDFDPVDAILISTGDGDDVLTVDAETTPSRAGLGTISWKAA
jgi:hypothetical protein